MPTLTALTTQTRTELVSTPVLLSCGTPLPADYQRDDTSFARAANTTAFSAAVILTLALTKPPFASNEPRDFEGLGREGRH